MDSRRGFWSERRVLIFGAGGFLGAQLVRTLVDRGAHVIGADRLEWTACWRVWSHPKPLLQRNAASFVNTLMTVEDAEPEVVFDLAGLSHINAAQEDPLGAFEANVAAAWNVLEACRRWWDRGHSLKAVVVSSSNHVYGSLRTQGRSIAVPWVETDALEPADCYGATKGMADLATRAYARGYGLPAVALRHANAFGPGDPHASHLVTGAVLSILAGEAPRLRGDGSTAKDYLYVDDVIAAYLRAAELVASGAQLEVVNAAPAAPTSVLEMLERLVKVTGHEALAPIVGTSVEQRGYTEHLDAKKFRTLGWAPRVDLDTGLLATYQWYAEHGGMEWAQ